MSARYRGPAPHPAPRWVREYLIPALIVVAFVAVMAVGSAIAGPS